MVAQRVFPVGILRVVRRSDIPVGSICSCLTSSLAIANHTPAFLLVPGSFPIQKNVYFFLIANLVLRDEFLGGQLCLCCSDQVLGQVALFAFVAFLHLSIPVRASYSMWLMIASSSFVSHRWYWSPTSRGVLIRSQSEQALFTPPFLGASPDWGRQCIPR